MEVRLNESLFTNNRYSVRYGEGKEALFTIVDEEFPGLNTLGRVNRITILVRTVASDGTASDASLRTSVIGIGDGVVGVQSSVPSLRGKVLSRDNMSDTTVILYE